MLLPDAKHALYLTLASRSRLNISRVPSASSVKERWLSMHICPAIPSTSRLSVPMSVNVQPCFFILSMSVFIIRRLYSSEEM